MTIPFVVQNGQVFINQAFVEQTKSEYPLFIASKNYEWVLFKDGNMEMRDENGTLRVKTFTQGSV